MRTIFRSTRPCATSWAKIARWREHYINRERPHSALGYKTPEGMRQRARASTAGEQNQEKVSFLGLKTGSIYGPIRFARADESRRVKETRAYIRLLIGRGLIFPGPVGTCASCPNQVNGLERPRPRGF
ncbi:MAG: transposase [Candidatus Koribacter versatilis]|uniref:Transposase n=1 Tax=Candidatus Korobacter versatilis TaxID=658062 RepID=A0A932EQJ3_9BACT|nr:transposase [Candidatus Koribacter versatilis]